MNPDRRKSVGATYYLSVISAFTLLHALSLSRLRRQLPPQGAERAFPRNQTAVKIQFVGHFVLLKHPLRCHPRTKRSGVKDLRKRQPPDPVYTFSKSYFCITKIKFLAPTVRRSFTPCKALRLRMTGAGSVGLNAQYTPINSQIPLCRDDTDVLVGKSLFAEKCLKIFDKFIKTYCNPVKNVI